jgi:hypothetical protein
MCVVRRRRPCRRPVETSSESFPTNHRFSFKSPLLKPLWTVSKSARGEPLWGSRYSPHTGRDVDLLLAEVEYQRWICWQTTDGLVSVTRSDQCPRHLHPPPSSAASRFQLPDRRCPSRAPNPRWTLAAKLAWGAESWDPSYRRGYRSSCLYWPPSRRRFAPTQL